MFRNKKIKKLLKNPKLFISDAIKNKKHYLINEKVDGVHQFTVVSAVYGVEKYLDDYFKSLVNQSLDFKKHIFLVLVDDGSLDNSAEIIKKWQKKYPNNITYVKKENGGQASARNLGLNYVQTEWVTFIDPDDYVNITYFENIDKVLIQDKNNDIGMIACRWKIFHESNNTFNFNHPLDFRFKNGNQVINHKNDKKFLTSSVATSFYRNSIIKKHKITFNENIKPNFEDGYFSAKYFLYMNYNSIAYIEESHYIYRKRAIGVSTLDSSWINPDRFDVVLQEGYLSLLNDSIIENKIPLAIQRVIMYDIVWYFKKIINTPQSISFLSKEEKDKFKALVYEVFKKIDSEVIMSFELAGFWFYHKVGFLGMLKGEQTSFNIVYIDEYDDIKELIKVRYFYYGEEPLEEFKVDGEYVLPTYMKNRRHDFMGDLFCTEKIIWLPIKTFSNYLSIQIMNVDTRISFNGKQFKDKVNIKDIIRWKKKPIAISKKIPLHVESIKKLSQTKLVKNRYKDAYVIMDRDTQADDNAEHFYRYLKEEHPELNIYFILSKNSHDYNRLKREGFHLLPFDSLSHKLALLNAKYLISSHADKYVVDYLKASFYGDLIKYKFIFLQHGVIRDDISTWLNNKNIDLFVTSMPTEYASIAQDSKYKFTDKEVALTGLARHDKLVLRTEPTEKVILIMPTWRNSLVGDLVNMSAQRDKTDAFYESDYAKHWKSVLHSNKLKELASSFGYKVVFFPHVNMGIYIDWFNAPSWIEVRTHKTDPILHKLFRRAKIMITDYSSVFFEFAILKKAILYYQFDFEYMYGGNHSSQLGYFDFEKDGFGPVSYNENELFSNLNNILNDDGLPSSKYLSRMLKALPFRDGKNRERTLKAIQKLNKREEKTLNKNILTFYQNKAESLKNLDLLNFTLEKTLSFDKDNSKLLQQLIENEIDRGNIYKTELMLNTIGKKDLKSYEKLHVKLDSKKNIIDNFSQDSKNILQKMNLYNLLKYSNIKTMYNNKQWSILQDIYDFVDISTIPHIDLSHFYYMWGRTLRLVNQKERALDILALSLSFNDIKPNASLWEYASTLYEVYDSDEITQELILKPFKENGYKVENIDYALIKTWFEKKHYKQVSVAFELINIDSIEEKDLSHFYYMWGRTLFFLDNHLESIKKLKHIKNKNTFYRQHKKEILISMATSMIEVENWEDSYILWKKIYVKYPNLDRVNVCKNIIISLKYLNKRDELELFKNKFIKYKFLETNDNDIEILNCL